MGLSDILKSDKVLYWGTWAAYAASSVASLVPVTHAPPENTGLQSIVAAISGIAGTVLAIRTARGLIRAQGGCQADLAKHTWQMILINTVPAKFMLNRSKVPFAINTVALVIAHAFVQYKAHKQRPINLSLTESMAESGYELRTDDVAAGPPPPSGGARAIWDFDRPHNTYQPPEQLITQGV